MSSELAAYAYQYLVAAAMAADQEAHYSYAYMFRAMASMLDPMVGTLRVMQTERTVNRSDTFKFPRHVSRVRGYRQTDMRTVTFAAALSPTTPPYDIPATAPEAPPYDIPATAPEAPPYDIPATVPDAATDIPATDHEAPPYDIPTFPELRKRPRKCKSVFICWPRHILRMCESHPTDIIIVDNDKDQGKFATLGRTFVYPQLILAGAQRCRPEDILEYCDAASDDTFPQLWIRNSVPFVAQEHTMPRGWIHHPQQPFVLLSPGWTIYDMVAKNMTPTPS